MGEDAASPVDTRLRVKGLRNVRIADASIVPQIPVSALNAPSMLIGYRAAEFILADKGDAHLYSSPSQVSQELKVCVPFISELA